MSSYIKIPALNPIRLFVYGSEPFFYDSLKRWEYKAGYVQKYQFGDALYLQLQIKGVPEKMTAQIIDRYGNELLAMSITQMNTVALYPEYTQFFVLNTFPAVAGICLVKLTIPSETGQTITFISEPIDLQRTHENTVLVQYGNEDQNDFDCIFTDENAANGIRFGLRIEGGVHSWDQTPGGNYTMFEDMQYRPEMLSATPFNAYKWTFGPAFGLPFWMVEKINRVFSCLETKIDGVQYVRNEGAKLESTTEPYYPLRSCAIELLPKETEQSKDVDLRLFLCSNTTILCSEPVLLTSQIYY